MKKYKAAYEALATEIKRIHDEAKKRADDERSEDGENMYLCGTIRTCFDIMIKMVELEPKGGE